MKVPAILRVKKFFTANLETMGFHVCCCMGPLNILDSVAHSDVNKPVKTFKSLYI